MNGTHLCIHQIIDHGVEIVAKLSCIILHDISIGRIFQALTFMKFLHVVMDSQFPLQYWLCASH